jgi:hypothetical protein
MQYLAGTPRLSNDQYRHLAAWLHRHELVVVLVILAIMAVFLILLAIPVLYDAVFNAFSSGMDRAAKGTFLFGFGVLIVGLASGIRIIDIIGGAVMAAVIVGIIVENYLTAVSRPRAAGPARFPGACRPRARPRPHYRRRDGAPRRQSASSSG